MATTQNQNVRSSSAFTLVEMLVAVGAVALVSVALAAVFQTVGRTVNTGKRISLLTQQAAVLEAQMRADFARMSREGFLLIRNQFAMDATAGSILPTTVPTYRYKGDPIPRPRRIDELMFFATGEYRTAREDLIPGRKAESRAARIYYGHGQKGVQPAPTSNASNSDVTYSFDRPEFDNRFWFYYTNGSLPAGAEAPMTAQHRLGGKIPILGDSTRGYQNPGINYYASDWNLVRHATLLQKPRTSSQGAWPSDRPKPNVQNDQWAANFNKLGSDNYYQISGQPASPSIFRVIAELLPITNPTDRTPGKLMREYLAYFSTDKDEDIFQSLPRFSSGVVDIATTDLSEIAFVVNGAKLDPSRIKNGGSMFADRKGAAKLLEPVLPKLESSSLDASLSGFRRYFESQNGPSGSDLSDPNSIKTDRVGIMQAWMMNALPATSAFMPMSPAMDSAAARESGSMDGMLGRLGARIRYEPSAPDLRAMLDAPPSTKTGQAATTRDVAIRRGDVLTVGLTGIAPHCTEFIVEWSWGQTYPTTGTYVDEFNNIVQGKTIWYGRSLIGYKADGSADVNQRFGQPNPEVYRYEPLVETRMRAYWPAGAFAADGKTALVTPTGPPAYEPFKGDLSKSTTVQNYKVADWLIHGSQKRSGVQKSDQSSINSFFGYFDPSFVPQVAGDPPSMPWPWPKMIRVTFTLADPNDPSVEQTFQYVYNVPETPQP